MSARRKVNRLHHIRRFCHCLTHLSVPVVFQQWPSAPCSSCCSTTEPHLADGSASQVNAPYKGSWKRRSRGCALHRSLHWAPAARTLECTLADKPSAFGFRIGGTYKGC